MNNEQMVIDNPSVSETTDKKGRHLMTLIIFVLLTAPMFLFTKGNDRPFVAKNVPAVSAKASDQQPADSEKIIKIKNDIFLPAYLSLNELNVAEDTSTQNLVLGPVTADLLAVLDKLKTDTDASTVIPPLEEISSTEKQSEETASTQPEIKRTYTIKKGEDLWQIAGHANVYGDPSKWIVIYEANKDKIGNPNAIYENQVIVIPGKKE